MDNTKKTETIQEQLIEDDRKELDQKSAASELEWLSQQLDD